MIRHRSSLSYLNGAVATESLGRHVGQKDTRTSFLPDKILRLNEKKDWDAERL